MFKLETKELKISDGLRKRIEIICNFAGVKYKLVEGNIISVKDQITIRTANTMKKILELCNK